jgi:hypothetical protein
MSDPYKPKGDSSDTAFADDMSKAVLRVLKKHGYEWSKVRPNNDYSDDNPLAWSRLIAVRGDGGPGAEIRTFDIEMALCAPEDPELVAEQGAATTELKAEE